MADCTRKLRQERGASVVFALVIFLIVTIFSWTMVNGALTAAQNAAMQREEEQAYLSVTSAARLFCHEAALQALSLRKQTESETWTDLPDDINAIQKLLLDMVRDIEKGNEASKTLTISPERTDSLPKPDSLKKVNMTLTMNPDYSVTAKFENTKNAPTDPDISQNLKYYVSVTLKCTKDDSVSNVDDNEVIRTLTWEVKSVERGRPS